MASWDFTEVQPGLPIKADHVQNASADWQGDVDANGNTLQDVGEITFTDPSATRDNLGLGDAATKDVGTGSGDVAAGDHNHSGVYEPANANIQSHIGSTSNPHSVTKSQVGLGNVENYGIASQGEAETGTATDKYMTPERVAQAIAELAPEGASDLDDLSDVTITEPSDGHVLTYDSGSWINAEPAGGTSDLGDLSDVEIDSPSEGQVLTYDNDTSTWINAAPPSGSLPTQTGHANAVLTTDGSDAAWFDGLKVASGLITLNKASADALATELKFEKRGTSGDSTAAVADGSSIGGLTFYGWNGSFYSPAAFIASNAAQNFSVGQGGSTLDFATALIGGFVAATRMQISGHGNVLINTTTDDETHKLQVNGGALTAFLVQTATAVPTLANGDFTIFSATNGEITIAKRGSDGTLRGVTLNLTEISE